MSSTPSLEPVGIDPTVDIAFKRLLGDPNHPALLLDFLNAVLAPSVPIVSATVENPIQLPDNPHDHFLVVDVLACDADGRRFQIEMQSLNEAALKARMMWGWADLYHGQLAAGRDYSTLRPVVGIWVLGQNIHRKAPDFHHCFVAYDPIRCVQLSEDMEIHTIELEKWRRRPSAARPLARWMQFFTEAEHWAEVPEALRDPVMEEAMDVLKDIKESAEWNAVYRARLDGIRRRVTVENDAARTRAALAETERALAAALAESERERAEKERERAEKERLEALLRRLGVDPASA